MRLSTSFRMRVGDDDVDRRAGRQQLHAVRRVAAQDDFGVHFFARLVDAAVGEDRAAQQRLRFVEVEVRAEVPRPDAFVPVARGVGGVAVLLRGDDEVEFR